MLQSHIVVIAVQSRCCLAFHTCSAANTSLNAAALLRCKRRGIGSLNVAKGISRKTGHKQPKCGEVDGTLKDDCSIASDCTSDVSADGVPAAILDKHRLVLSTIKDEQTASAERNECQQPVQPIIESGVSAEPVQSTAQPAKPILLQQLQQSSQSTPQPGKSSKRLSLTLSDIKPRNCQQHDAQSSQKTYVRRKRLCLDLSNKKQSCSIRSDGLVRDQCSSADDCVAVAHDDCTQMQDEDNPVWITAPRLYESDRTKLLEHGKWLNDL